MGEAVRELAVYSSSKVENNKICLMIAAGHQTRFGGSYAREEKLERGSGSILLQEIFQVRVPEMTFPAFLLDIFPKSTRRKMLLGEQRRAHFQFFPP